MILVGLDHLSRFLHRRVRLGVGICGTLVRRGRSTARSIVLVHDFSTLTLRFIHHSSAGLTFPLLLAIDGDHGAFIRRLLLAIDDLEDILSVSMIAARRHDTD